MQNDNLFFQTCSGYTTSNLSSSVTFPELINKIKTGGEFKDAILYARQFLKSDSEYSEIKEQLPCFLPNGKFHFQRRIDRLQALTSIIYIDIDADSCQEALDIKTDLIEQHGDKILTIYTSFGCKGLGILVPVEGLQPNNFKNAYKACYRALGLSDSIIDKACIDVARCAVIGYDEDIFVNEDAKPIDVSHVEDDESPYSIIAIKKTQFFLRNQIDFKHTNGLGYIFYQEGKECYKIYRNGKAEIGQRNNRMFGVCRSLILSNTHLMLDQRIELKEFFFEQNQYHCLHPLPVKDMENIWKKSCQYFDAGTLTTLNKDKKKVFFSPSMRFTPKQKMSLGAKLNGKARRENTLKRIVEEVNRLQELNGVLPTQKSVSLSLNLCLKTIKIYWKEVKQITGGNKASIIDSISIIKYIEPLLPLPQIEKPKKMNITPNLNEMKKEEPTKELSYSELSSTQVMNFIERLSKNEKQTYFDLLKNDGKTMGEALQIVYTNSNDKYPRPVILIELVA